MNGRKHQLVALLPMKAHSERVRGKNFRSFAGRPLFQWVLDTLLAVPEIDRIIINTDATEELAKFKVATGGRVLLRERKPELCGDFVSMNKVLADDVAAIDADAYVMTHTTNPLLRARTVKEAVDAHRRGVARGECDSLFTVNAFQSRFYRKDGSPINHDPNNLIRTQDLEPWFEENSNLYVFSRTSFAATNARIGKKPLLFETPRLESADIDDQTGWTIAEMLALSLLIAKTRPTSS